MHRDALERVALMMGTAIISLLVVGMGLVLSVETHTSDIYSSSANALATDSNSLEYIVQSNGRTLYVVSDLTFLENGSVKVTTELKNSTFSAPYYQSTSALSLKSFQFHLPSGKIQLFRDPRVSGTLKITRSAASDSMGLISYASVRAENAIVGINMNYSVTLLNIGDGLSSVLKSLNTNNGYYFFIPELISLSQMTSHTKPMATSVTNQGQNTYHAGADPQLNLSERDNTLTNYNVWYLDVSLSVSSLSPGGNVYSDSIKAAAISPLDNWLLVSDSLKISSIYNSQYSEVDAYGNAFFLGVFPLGAFDYWEGFPNVSVGESFSYTNFQLQQYGSFIDPIYTAYDYFGPYFLWSYNSGTFYNLNGYKDVVEYIVT